MEALPVLPGSIQPHSRWCSRRAVSLSSARTSSMLMRTCWPPPMTACAIKGFRATYRRPSASSLAYSDSSRNPCRLRPFWAMMDTFQRRSMQSCMCLSAPPLSTSAPISFASGSICSANSLMPLDFFTLSIAFMVYCLPVFL